MAPPEKPPVEALSTKHELPSGLEPPSSSYSYAQLTDPIPLEHPLAPFILSLRRDVLAPVYGILNQVDALRIAGAQSDPAVLSSIYAATRAVERNAIRLLAFAKESARSPISAPEPVSLHSVTHEAALLASAMFPRMFASAPAVDLPRSDAVTTLDRERLIQLLATLLYLSRVLMDKSDPRISLSISQSGPTSTATWSLGECTSFWPWPSFDALAEDPRVLSRNCFEVSFIHETCSVLGASVSIDATRTGLRLELPFEAIRAVDPMAVPENVVWTTAPVVVSSLAPESFAPLPGNVVVMAPDADPRATVAETGARVFLAHHTKGMSPDAVFRLVMTCVSMTVPVLLRSDALDYDTFQNFKDYVDAVIVEPCRKETLARYVVGLAMNDRRARRRPAEIHS